MSEAIYNSNMLLNTQQNIRLMFTWRVLLWKRICGVMLFLYVSVVNLWFTDTNVCLNSTASFLSVKLVCNRKTSDWRQQCLNLQHCYFLNINAYGLENEINKSFLSFFFWPLSIFDLPILITSLISSSSPFYILISTLKRWHLTSNWAFKSF